MNQIEKALSDYLGDMCGMRLKPHALTGLAKAAIAAMPVQTKPVAWMYEGPAMLEDETIIQDQKCFPVRQIYKPSGFTETPLYAHPPAQWQGIESAQRSLMDQIKHDAALVAALPEHERKNYERELRSLFCNPGITFPTPPAGGSDAE